MKLLFVLIILLAGCSMIPDYSRPELPVAEKIGDVTISENGKESATSIAWKDFFKSEELQKIIQTTIDNNRDLRIAALNVESARKLYNIEYANILPDIKAGVSATRTRSTEAEDSEGKSDISKTYSANLASTSFELDLFGRLRSQNEAALEEFLASEADREAVKISLIAETANAYLQLLADIKILKLVEETLAAQQKSYDIIALSHQSGIASRLDIAQIRTALETARVNKALYTRNVEQDKNALLLLMGSKNRELLNVQETLDDIKLDNNINAGISSEVLLLRPDIQKAEYSLKSANADIGAARAAFFPTISLTSSIGFASDDLSHLFSNGASGAWSFIPKITLPIFAGGANKSNLEYSEILKDVAVAEYEKAIQTAFKEVSDELSAKQTINDELAAQRQLVDATKESYDVSYARYRKGIDSFLNVLDAQRSLFLSQQNEVEVEKLLLSNMVNLYKSLGGGKE